MIMLNDLNCCINGFIFQDEWNIGNIDGRGTVFQGAIFLSKKPHLCVSLLGNGKSKLCWMRICPFFQYRLLQTTLDKLPNLRNWKFKIEVRWSHLGNLMLRLWVRLLSKCNSDEFTEVNLVNGCYVKISYDDHAVNHGSIMLTQELYIPL